MALFSRILCCHCYHAKFPLEAYKIKLNPRCKLASSQDENSYKLVADAAVASKWAIKIKQKDVCCKCGKRNSNYTITTI